MAGTRCRLAVQVRASPCSAVCVKGSCVERAASLCFVLFFNLSLVSQQEPVLVSAFFLRVHIPICTLKSYAFKIKQSEASNQ